MRSDQAAPGLPPWECEPRSVQKLESSHSCRVPVVVAKQTPKPLAAIHLPRPVTPSGGRLIQPAKATTISFPTPIGGV